MTIEIIHNSIRKKVKEDIEEALSIKVLYDNEGRANPNEDLSAFVSATIKPAVNIKKHVGESSAYRQTGVLILMIMCESGRGDQRALSIAASCVTAFKSKTVDGVVYETPSPESVGLNPNGYWQVNVTCPFYSDLQ